MFSVFDFQLQCLLQGWACHVNNSSQKGLPNHIIRNQWDFRLWTAVPSSGFSLSLYQELHHWTWHTKRITKLQWNL
jgi:hypothetical protein